MYLKYIPTGPTKELFPYISNKAFLEKKIAIAGQPRPPCTHAAFGKARGQDPAAQTVPGAWGCPGSHWGFRASLATSRVLAPRDKAPGAGYPGPGALIPGVRAEPCVGTRPDPTTELQ